MTQQAQVAARSRAYRARRRAGVLVVTIEVDATTVHALRRIGLIGADTQDRAAIANAAARFLNVAGPVAAMGDALFPGS